MDAVAVALERGVNITDPFVLKDDVLLIACADLSDDVRARISFDAGDFTLSRRHGRALAQVIDGETAALLSLFRTPRTIVDAVLENSRTLGKAPKALLDELIPHLETFLENRVLVPVGSEEQQEIRPRHEAGATIAGWEIVRCVSLIEDSEVYQLRKGSEIAALKIARTAAVRRQFDNEAAVLRRLDGCGVAPRLIDAGMHEERAFLIMEWASGVEASVASAERRHDRAALIEMCASIAAAYATLHARGVLHADVHPRNAIVGDRVLLVDFGLSRFAEAPGDEGRGGVSYFRDPESFRDEPPSERGEQYSVAALLYLLLAGVPYLDFRLEREEMLRQIDNDPPLPFATRGIPPWPDVEAILFRALEKHPADRYDSVEEMAARLADARDAAVRESLAAPLSEEATRLLESTLESFARGGTMFTTRYAQAPTASINYGCAGAALGLLRIAETRGDPALLALAEVWCSRARKLIGTEGAFQDDDELSGSVVGDVTPYHTESGVHAARAMVAAAMGASTADAIDAFLLASRGPCAELDLTLGRSGSLLAAAMLLPISRERDALHAFGSETMESIWRELDARPTLDGNLGMAHGWSGYLYAALRWCDASGDALPPRLVERLHALGERRVVDRRGAYWPATSAGMTASWCNGTAGHVFLFTLAHRVLADDHWLHLAELAAWNTWDEPRGVATLCCGSAGRAYALLNLYKHTGATEWLSRARQLANHAASAASATSQRTHSLWKGELGVAVLIADLAAPEGGRMVFFE